MKTRILGSLAMVMACGSVASAQLWNDNFQTSGGFGPQWNLLEGTWSAVGGQGTHTSGGVEVIQHTLANLAYVHSRVSMDMFTNANNQFAAIQIGLGGSDSIQVKLQQQAGAGNFSHIGIYSQSTLGPVAPSNFVSWVGTTTLPDLTFDASGFVALPVGAAFNAARVYVRFQSADVIQVDIDANIDGSIDYTYSRTGVSTVSGNFGTRYGLAAWGVGTAFDNWRVQNRNHVIVDFDYTPGGDGRLGTNDDVAIIAPSTFAAQATQLSTEFAGLGLSFPAAVGDRNEIVNNTTFGVPAFQTAPNLLGSLGAADIGFGFTRPIYRVGALLGISGGSDRMIAFNAANVQIGSIVGDDTFEFIATVQPIARVLIEPFGGSTTPTIDNLTFTGALVADGGPNSNVQSFGAGNYVAGSEFTLDSTTVIRSLGYVDAEGDGLAGPHMVGLWNSASQALLAQATVTPSSATLPSANGTARWYMASISPIVLVPGTYRVAGEVLNDGGALSNDKVALAGAIITAGYVRTDFPNGGFAFPNLTFVSEAIRATASILSVCRPDLTTNAIPGSPGYGVPNGVLNNDDFFYYLSQFAAGNLAVADLTTSAIPGSPGYGVPNGILNNDDFFFYLSIFAAGC